MRIAIIFAAVLLATPAAAQVVRVRSSDFTEHAVVRITDGKFGIPAPTCACDDGQCRCKPGDHCGHKDCPAPATCSHPKQTENYVNGSFVRSCDVCGATGIEPDFDEPSDPPAGKPAGTDARATDSQQAAPPRVSPRTARPQASPPASDEPTYRYRSRGRGMWRWRSDAGQSTASVGSC